MNLMSKQAVRKPIFTMLMVLLLSLSIALSCIGYSALISAKLQQESITTEYTTVAIPKHPEMSDPFSDELEVALQKRVYADRAAQEAPQLEMIDRRGYLAGHIPGSRSLSSSSVEPGEYNEAFDEEPYSLAVFALRCENVTDTVCEESFQYQSTFSVEEVVSLSSAYDCFPPLDTVHILGNICQKDGTVPFQVGRTYLVFGTYYDRRVTSGAGFLLHEDGTHTIETYRQIEMDKRWLIPFPQIRSNENAEPSSLEEGTLNGLIYHYPTEGQLPWATEYEGSVEEFLSSEEGKVWKEEILPICQYNHESAVVILTDKITSMYSFNNGDASLVSGRFFTQEEYDRGEAVCIVSAAYADLNGLKLGDSLEIDYYDSGFVDCMNGGQVNSMFETEDPGPFRQRNCLMPEDAIGVRKKYTIVGMYTGARFAFGIYHFNADTILVPKKSVPNAQEYEEPSNSLLNTFVLKNGTEQEFEQYMEEQDLGNQFLYFNQEFTAAQGALEALEQNALRLFCLGVGVFLLVGILFLFLNFRRMKPIIQTARRLGRPAKKIWGEIQVLLLFQVGMSTLLGGVLAAILYKTITRTVLSEALTLQPIALAEAALLLFVALFLIASCWAVWAVSRKLMKGK